MILLKTKNLGEPLDNQAKINIKKTQNNISETDILEFLENNSSFFMFHEELAEKLEMPAKKAKNIVNIDAFEASKWKKRAQKLEKQNELLVRTSIFNLESEGLLHDVIVEIVRSTTIEELKNILNVHLKDGMELDKVSLFIIGETITAEKLEDLFSGNENVKLRTIYSSEDAFMHKPLEKDIASDALLKLEIDGEYYGMLALGSLDESRFHAGQGSELLNFFARILTVQVKKLLG